MIDLETIAADLAQQIKHDHPQSEIQLKRSIHGMLRDRLGYLLDEENRREQLFDDFFAEVFRRVHGGRRSLNS